MIHKQGLAATANCVALKGREKVFLVFSEAFSAFQRSTTWTEMRLSVCL